MLNVMYLLLYPYVLIDITLNIVKKEYVKTQFWKTSKAMIFIYNPMMVRCFVCLVPIATKQAFLIPQCNILYIMLHSA